MSKTKGSIINRILNHSLLEGRNPGIDRALFRFFNGVSEVGKSLITKKTGAFIYKQLADYLLQIAPGYEAAQPLLGSKEEEALLLNYKKKRFLEVAEPCDVVLIRGNLRISHIIQTLTKSPYSHSAFYCGDGNIIEAEPNGVLLSPIDKYLELDMRLCRPVMLSNKGKKIVMQHMQDMLKIQPRYDVTNMEKLLFKYWYTKFRPDIKVYIGGTTDFERFYICSGMIAHGFHKAGYPVVPSLRFKKKAKIKSLRTLAEYEKMVQLCRKNYSQIVPGDFDNSPFFASVKFLYLDSKYNAKRRFTLEKEVEAEE